MKSGIKIRGYLVRFISDGNGIAVLFSPQDRPNDMKVAESHKELPFDLRNDPMVREHFEVYCPGHTSVHGPMGESTFCDGSCMH